MVLVYTYLSEAELFKQLYKEKPAITLNCKAGPYRLYFLGNSYKFQER